MAGFAPKGFTPTGLTGFKPMSLKVEVSEVEEVWTVESILAKYYPDDRQLQLDIMDLLKGAKDESGRSILKQFIFDKLKEKRANVKQIRSDSVGANIPPTDVYVWGAKYGSDQWIKIYEADQEEHMEITKASWLAEIYFQNKAHGLNDTCNFISPKIHEYGSVTFLPNESDLPSDEELTAESLARMKAEREKLDLKDEAQKKKLYEQFKEKGEVKFHARQTPYDKREFEKAKLNASKSENVKNPSGTYFYTIMDLIPEFERKMEVSACVDIAEKVFETNELLKENGVHHNDLRPDNVRVRIIDGEPVPIIIDFGETDNKYRNLAHLSQYEDDPLEAFKIFCNKESLKGLTRWDITSKLADIRKSKEESAKLALDRRLLEAREITPSPSSEGGSTRRKRNKKRKTQRKRNKPSLRRKQKK
jgi:hypothetical protein